MQGVRQLAPSEVFASAPGGSDSIVSETFAALLNDDMLGTQFQLGIQLEQPATISAPATALTRTSIGMRTTMSPAIPRPNALELTGRPRPLQPSLRSKSGGDKATNTAPNSCKPLNRQIL